MEKFVSLSERVREMLEVREPSSESESESQEEEEEQPSSGEEEVWDLY